MRRAVQETNFTSSLLDMLCSALGGVALLVFVFAAIRRDAEKQEGLELENLLQVEIEPPFDFLRIGDDFSFSIYDGTNRVTLPFDQQEATQGSLSIRRSNTASSKFLVFVTAQKGAMLQITLWLRKTNAKYLVPPTPAASQKSYRDLLSQKPGANVKVKVTWASRGTEYRGETNKSFITPSIDVGTVD